MQNLLSEEFRPGKQHQTLYEEMLRVYRSWKKNLRDAKGGWRERRRGKKGWCLVCMGIKVVLGYENMVCVLKLLQLAVGSNVPRSTTKKGRCFFPLHTQA